MQIESNLSRIIFLSILGLVSACSSGGSSGHGSGSTQNFSISNSSIYGSGTVAQGSPVVMEHQCHMFRFDDGAARELFFTSSSEHCFDPNNGSGPLSQAGFNSEEITLINEASRGEVAFVDLLSKSAVNSCSENDSAPTEPRYCVSVPKSI